MATLLAEKMFTNCNSSLLREHTVTAVILCVLQISVWHAAQSFDHTASITYCL